METHTLASRIASYFKQLIYHQQGVAAALRSEWGRIAVIVSHEKNGWALAAIQRFVSALRDQMGYQNTPDIEVHATQGSCERTRQVMNTILSRQKSHHDYELVVTVGNWCSKEVRDILDTWDVSLPQVFMGVSDPVTLGLVDSLESTGRNVSGVTAVLASADQQVEMLRALLPQLKNILLVYYPCAEGSDGLNERIGEFRDRMVGAFEQQKMAVNDIRIGVEDDISAVVRQHAEKADLVCTLPEANVFANIEALIRVCNEVRVPLCTAELSSVYQGASIGFGEHGGTYGPYAASIVYDVLVNRRALRTIPVIDLPSVPQMRFNQEALDAQGVELSKEMRHLMAMRSVFNDTV